MSSQCPVILTLLYFLVFLFFSTFARFLNLHRVGFHVSILYLEMHDSCYTPLLCDYICIVRLRESPIAYTLSLLMHFPSLFSYT
jgi:hypothetical protein